MKLTDSHKQLWLPWSRHSIFVTLSLLLLLTESSLATNWRLVPLVVPRGGLISLIRASDFLIGRTVGIAVAKRQIIRPWPSGRWFTRTPGLRPHCRMNSRDMDYWIIQLRIRRHPRIAWNLQNENGSTPSLLLLKETWSCTSRSQHLQTPPRPHPLVTWLS